MYAAILITDLGPRPAHAVGLLRREFGLSIPAIRAAVETGRPVATRTLFDRRDSAGTERLAATLEALDRLGCAYRASQLVDGAAYAPSETYFELTPARLRAKIAARQASIDEQQRYAELRGEAD